MQGLDDCQLMLPELWATWARFQPDKTAVVCGAARRTWSEFNAGMNRVANGLLAAGVGRGERVALVMSNSIETLEVMFGIAKAGACIVPVSGLLTADQVAVLLDDSDAVALFVSAPFRALVEPQLARRPALRRGLAFAHGFEAPGFRDLAAWRDAAPGHEPPVRYDLGDAFNIIYSSGTTGLPKGIVQTHRARQHWSYSNALEMRFDDTAVALVTTSLYSNGTWFMLLPPLFVGGTIVILEKFTPEAFLEAVAREGVTHSFVVPTQCIGLLASPALAAADLSSLRVLVSAGSPLREDIKHDVLTRICGGLMELYGFSEGFATIIKPEDIARKPGSVGRPVIGFDLRILDDEGREVPAGEAGEIAGYGAGLMRGYHKRDAETAAAIWRDERGRTFFRSGDIGRVDEDGFLHILDRRKDMILCGGFNVFPKDIEAIVAMHPDVEDVTVIGIPHPKWGEVPLALVIPRAGAALDLSAVREWANARLAKPQQLARVEVRAEFPRNALGKVLKRLLREQYA
jgi:acyl-CoA synthetase (AMP-forming)/AMP-acid ligase II